MTTVQVHIDAADTTASYHCEQAGDRVTIRIDGGSDSVTVYVTGTHQQIVEWAFAVCAAAQPTSLSSPEPPNG